jgi:hypothetical protein
LTVAEIANILRVSVAMLAHRAPYSIGVLSGTGLTTQSF